jgi:hypothetical protein
MTGSAATVQPNMYQLSGDGIHVAFSRSSLDGQPLFSYQDHAIAKSFRGSDIEIESCALGEIVSVTIVRTVDVGSTSFSLLIPFVNLIGHAAGATIHTLGITALHRTSLAPPLDQGQRTTYPSVARLTGTAKQVESLSAPKST